LINRLKNLLVKFSVRVSKKAIIILVVLFVATFTMSLFIVGDITIEPGTYYTEDEIKAMVFKNRMDKVTYLLYIGNKFFKQKDIPFVTKIDVEVVGRNSVMLRVYDKIVIGCVEFMGSFMYFDVDGRVVESTSEHMLDIPIIVGLKFDQIVLYEKLNVQNENMFDIILNITNSIKDNGLDVEKVEFLMNEEVLLYCYGCIVELGRRDYYDGHIRQLGSIISSVHENYGEQAFRIDMKNSDDGNGNHILKPLY